MANIASIPPEIWAKIFHLLCNAPIAVHTLDNSRHKQEFPWSVGLVCSHWRNIFLSHPPLWASINLTDIHYYDHIIGTSYGNEINRRLALYLERSREYPLEIYAFLSDNSFTTTAMTLLSGCSHRWKAVNLVLSCGYQLDLMIARKGKMPILESLSIHTCLVKSCHQDVFKIAPRLKYVEVGSWGTGHTWIFPWTQMTKLRVSLDDQGPLGDVAKLLQSLHTVEEFRLEIIDAVMFDESFPQYMPTRLDHLRVLEVPHPSILSWLETPVLSDLHFRDYEEGRSGVLDVHADTISLIQRSGCKIRKLYFVSSRALHIGILCDVEEIHLECTVSRGPFQPSIDSLPISAGPVYLPKLRLITLVCTLGNGLRSLARALTKIIDLFSGEQPRDEGSTTPIVVVRSCDPITHQLERITIKTGRPQVGPWMIPVELLELVKRKWPLIQIE